MSVWTGLRCWGLALVFFAAACGNAPTAPGGGEATPAERDALSGAELSAEPFVIVVLGQLVSLERPRGETERAWVQAQITVHPTDRRGGAAQMDGAILVVTANDGPMPQTSPNAEWLRVEIKSGTVESGLISFAGIGTLRDREGNRTSFDITGTARQSPTNPDCIIWGILGGEVFDGATFEARGFGKGFGFIEPSPPED